MIDGGVQVVDGTSRRIRAAFRQSSGRSLALSAYFLGPRRLLNTQSCLGAWAMARPTGKGARRRRRRRRWSMVKCHTSFLIARLEAM